MTTIELFIKCQVILEPSKTEGGTGYWTLTVHCVLYVLYIVISSVGIILEYIHLKPILKYLL
jgi:cytochrome b561